MNIDRTTVDPMTASFGRHQATRYCLAVAAILFLYPAATLGQASSAPSSAADPLAEVTVSAERPGPSLWRVSSGHHVLWLLGTLSPLPKNMQWRSREVERVITRAQGFIEPESVTAKLGFFRTIRYLPALLRVRLNPDGKTLEDVVPHDLYARWSVLKSRYMPKDKSVERFRPAFAAMTLYSRALKLSGLTADDAVLATVRKLVRSAHVGIASPNIRFDVKDPRTIIQDLTRPVPEAEQTCFAATVERLESDIPNMQARANAWAIGDIATLEAVRSSSTEKLCLDAVTSSPELRAQFATLRQESSARWLQAVDSALATQSETLAVVPIADLLDPDGRLAQLQSRGYSITLPQGLALR